MGVVPSSDSINTVQIVTGCSDRVAKAVIEKAGTNEIAPVLDLYFRLTPTELSKLVEPALAAVPDADEVINLDSDDDEAAPVPAGRPATRVPPAVPAPA